MKAFTSIKIFNTGASGIPDRRGLDSKGKISKRGLVSIIVESVLIGFALFSAFLIQKVYFDLQDQQILIGQGELFRMSLGIAFCYAFVSVLRRTYLSGNNNGKTAMVKLIARLVVETYMFYLALLFVAVDINFKSTKLALGIAFLMGAALVVLYKLILIPVLFKTRSYHGRRKITLKKPAPSTVPDHYANDIRGNNADTLHVSRLKSKVELTSFGNGDESSRSDDLSKAPEFSGEPR